MNNSKYTSSYLIKYTATDDSRPSRMYLRNIDGRWFKSTHPLLATRFERREDAVELTKQIGEQSGWVIAVEEYMTRPKETAQ